jgi:hypothetical protein
MSTQPELIAHQCRVEAAACRSLAEQAMTQAHRVMLEHIAGTWDRIARDITEQDRRS